MESVGQRNCEKRVLGMADVKWIKISTDIFENEKILFIEKLPKKDTLLIIWFKLLSFAGQQNNGGVFLFNNSTPYTSKMLATVFKRSEKTVKDALKIFEEYGMIETVDGVITIPNWNKYQTLDSYEKKKERDREYQAKRRADQKRLIAKKSSDKSSDVAFSDKDIDKDNIEKENIKRKSDEIVKGESDYGKNL